MKNETMYSILEKYNEYNEFGRMLNKTLKPISPGHIEYRLEVLKEHQALPNMAHGGLLAAMMDGVLGVAALSAVAEENKFVATVEFKINYLKPVKVGDMLVGVGKVIQKGGKILISEGTLTVNGVEVSRGIGTFRSYSAEHVETD